MSVIVRDFDIIGCEGNRLVATAYGNASAPPIVMLHGGGQSRYSWKRTASFFAEHGWYVLTYDARGHGDSDWSADGRYALDFFERDLRNIVQTLSVPTAVVGASLGGLTSINVIASGIELTPPMRSLTLVDILPKANREGTRQTKSFMQRTMGGFTSVNQAAEMLAEFRQTPVMDIPLKGIEHALRKGDEGRLYWHWDPLILTLEDMDPLDEVEKRLSLGLSTSKLPVLLVHGELSEVVTTKEVKNFKQLSIKGEVIEVPGMGHAVIGGQISMAHDAMLRFIERT